MLVDDVSERLSVAQRVRIEPNRHYIKYTKLGFVFVLGALVNA